LAIHGNALNEILMNENKIDHFAQTKSASFNGYLKGVSYVAEGEE